MSELSKERNSKLRDLRDELMCWQGYYDPLEDKEQHEMFILAADAVAELLALRKEREAAVPVGYTSKSNLENATGRNLEFFSKDSSIYADPIALYAAPPAQPVAVPETLPCPVLLEPGLRFGKGVRTQIMLDALQRRAEYYAELEAMTPEQRAEHEAGIKEFAAMLAAPVVSGWIPCSERMPEDGTDADGNAIGYLVLYEAGKEPNGGFNVGVWNVTYLRSWWKGYVTHWMPLPAAPGKQPLSVELLAGALRNAPLAPSDSQGRQREPMAVDCWCRTCRPVSIGDMRFVVCPDCGNKRCPKANDHRNSCTGSNEPGQDGSAYPATPGKEG